MGIRGPVPKRDMERRRQNKPDTPTDSVKVPGAVQAPSACKDWHPIARDWYRSLKGSGQSKFYEPSDWMTAKYAAELMSKLLSYDRPSAQLVASLNSLLASLLATEGDRRRVRMEIERLPETGNAKVTTIDAYRRARRG